LFCECLLVSPIWCKGRSWTPKEKWPYMLWNGSYQSESYTVYSSLYLTARVSICSYINVRVYLCLLWSRLSRTTDKVLFLDYFMTMSVAGLYYVEGRVIYE
jgi:hypothetical protein